MIRVVLPAHLRTLARLNGEVHVNDGEVTLSGVLDTIEERYPMLRGTIRDAITHRRRPFIRFFACRRDLSNDAADTRLPEEVISGDEPLLIVGAMAGG